MKPVVSAVLGSFNRHSFLKLAIESIRRETDGIPREIIVVDGGSTDGALQWLVKQKDIITIIQHNHGDWQGKPIERRTWGYFMNLAFKICQGHYVLMISDDTILVSGAIRNGIDFFEQQVAMARKVGAVAFYFRDLPMMRDSSYRVQLVMDRKVYVNHGLYLRAALEEVGWAEEEAYRFYCADQDLSLKLWQAGYEILDCPDAYVEHFDQHAFRAAGSTTMLTDNETLLKRWSSVYSVPRKPQAEDLIKPIFFLDSHRTSDRFVSALPLRRQAHIRVGNWLYRAKRDPRLGFLKPYAKWAISLSRRLARRS